MAKRITAFLFGAGASHGAGRIWPYPPPLGTQLFPRLTREFPETWGKVPERSRPLFERNFEDGMSSLLKHHDEIAHGLMIDMALYFSRFQVPDDSSDAYSALVALVLEHMDGVPVTFATLNYDCLLEGALESFGLSVAYYPGEVGPGAFNVWKLHGSCNFIPDTGTNWVIGTTFKNVKQIYSGYIKAVSLPEVRRYYAGEPGNRQSIPPMMSYYDPSKTTYVSEGTLDVVRQTWATSALAASRIVVIGARPVLEESHVWQPIVDSSAEILYVGGESPGLKKLEARSEGRVHLIARKFSEALPLLRDLARR